MCFVPPIADPLTAVQSILSSSCSLTSPTVQTLSPRMRYKPSGTTWDGSSSSGVLIIRSIASLRTYIEELVSLCFRRAALNGSNSTYEIGGLVGSREGPDEYSRVSGDNQHLPCNTVRFPKISPMIVTPEPQLSRASRIAHRGGGGILTVQVGA